jgi:hypothetical protein
MGGLIKSSVEEASHGEICLPNVTMVVNQIERVQVLPQQFVRLKFWYC